MPETVELKVSTANEHLGEIETTFEAEIPSSYEEFADWHGGEEKVLEVLQSDAKRRIANTARPALREAEAEPDEGWSEFAQNIGQQYKPGQRSNFGRAEVSADELSNVQSSEDLIAMLRKAGVKVS